MYKLKMGMGAMLLLLMGCMADQPEVPAELLQPQAMIDILTDIHLVEGNAQVARRFTNAGLDFYDSSYRLIYAIHETDMQTFDSSYRFYIRHPRFFEEMYQQVIDNINHFEEQK